MKTRYILIHCEKELTQDTVFYTVWIGSSERDTKDLAFLQSLKFIKHFYFRKYDDEAAQFKNNCAKSLFPGCFMPLLELKQETLTAHQAVLLVRSGYFGKSYLPKVHSEFRRKFDVKFNAQLTAIYGTGNDNQ